MRLFICDDVNFLREMFPRSETDRGDYRVNRKWPSGPTGQANHIGSITQPISFGKQIRNRAEAEFIHLSPSLGITCLKR